MVLKKLLIVGIVIGNCLTLSKNDSVYYYSKKGSTLKLVSTGLFGEVRFISNQCFW